MRVRLTRELRLNLTGYDRLPAIFAPGEQDVPAAVAEYIAGHPSWGEVLEDVLPDDQGDGDPAPDDDDEVKAPPHPPKPARQPRKAGGKGTA